MILIMHAIIKIYIYIYIYAILDRLTEIKA